MFTGLIERQGQVIANTVVTGGNRLVIDALLPELASGESIAVNGVCLTLLDVEKPLLAFDLSEETLKCTNLAVLCKGDTVNLERAMGASGRFGGHYVTGHVDTVAVLTALQEFGGCLDITVSNFALSSAAMYLIAKGSITLDGVSLTINEVKGCEIKLMLIPHTLEKTTFHQLKLGHCFNVEFDYLARIVAHQLALSGQLHQEVCS
ncbi:MAG: riboflavin synthase subunit alpha [Legionellales bacterium RIFCSPHIGHO2_12_FULL_42_9]|nr:MAG: riboflavin synthase subunit alpha [Legionellales bacterium RIFCSPHIGHO2_12_FULL_42_9]